MFNLKKEQMSNLRTSFEHEMTKDYPEWRSNMLSTKVENLYHFYCCGYVSANNNITNFVEAANVTTKNRINIYQD